MHEQWNEHFSIEFLCGFYGNPRPPFLLFPTPWHCAQVPSIPSAYGLLRFSSRPPWLSLPFRFLCWGQSGGGGGEGGWEFCVHFLFSFCTLRLSMTLAPSFKPIVDRAPWKIRPPLPLHSFALLFLIFTRLDPFLSHQCADVPPSSQYPTELAVVHPPLLSYLRHYSLALIRDLFNCFPYDLLFTPV